MERVLTDKVVRARNHYRCDACEQWNCSGYSLNDCETPEQKLIVEAAVADKYKILPGQLYRKIVGIHDGEVCTYRARPGMHNVCLDLELWAEY